LVFDDGKWAAERWPVFIMVFKIQYVDTSFSFHGIVPCVAILSSVYLRGTPASGAALLMKIKPAFWLSLEGSSRLLKAHI
jgi:hypothetical protein